jgi:hypothetical protein
LPAAKARVRTIVTATHTRDELQFALDSFGRVGPSSGFCRERVGYSTASADAGRTAPLLQGVHPGLTTVELERLFTRETPEAYRFFSRTIDHAELLKLPWHRRILAYTRVFFLAFTMKLTPARRAIYAAALVSIVVGLAELYREVHLFLVPHPAFAPGTMWLLTGFLLVNFLVFVELADRLTLKNDLEIARGIQQAMLPRAAFQDAGVDAFGMTRPANTVGGDFYDIQALPDGRVLFALGDVAGKGSPASLLMALLLAMMRTLVDEGFEGAALAARLNARSSSTRRPLASSRSFLASEHGDGRIRLRERGPESASGTPRQRLIRTPQDRRHCAGDVRVRHL